jgi:hypothetical protein
VTGYARQLNLRKEDRLGVAERVQYLRDSIGQKLPTHNKVGMGIVRPRVLSVQGIWTNGPDLRPKPQSHEVALRAARARDYGLARLVDEVGLAGVVTITQRLLQAQHEAKEAALAALPKIVRTLPSE